MKTFARHLAEDPWADGDTDNFCQKVQDECGLDMLHLYVSGAGDLVLNHISVIKSNQGEGRGTRAMDMICDFADRHELRTILNTAHRSDSFGTTSRSRLIRFYKRFGFVENKGRNKDFRIRESMLRNPK